MTSDESLLKADSYSISNRSYQEFDSKKTTEKVKQEKKERTI